MGFQNQDDWEIVAKSDFIDWKRFENKTIFVTGATGLIGFNLVHSLVYVNNKYDLGMKIFALVRDEERAKKRFFDCANDHVLDFIVGSVENLPEITEPIHYIVHGATPTSSKAFVDKPVETIKTSVIGTANVLELARKKNIEGMVYLSSMEIYGLPSKGTKVSESQIGTFSPNNVRNSYPIGKLESESLCKAFSSEYGIPVCSARLTQTFGSGVNYDDGRIFAYFGRCIAEKQNIVLKTTGETERCYLYTADAVTAILKLLLDGEEGAAYNVADESTYCSIAEMAAEIAKRYGISVKYDVQDTAKNGFPDTLYMDLDTSRLKELGWKCQVHDAVGKLGVLDLFELMVLHCFRIKK